MVNAGQCTIDGSYGVYVGCGRLAVTKVFSGLVRDPRITPASRINTPNVFLVSPMWVFKKVTRQQAIPLPNYERIPFTARWERFRGVFQRCVETTLESGFLFRDLWFGKTNWKVLELSLKVLELFDFSWDSWTYPDPNVGPLWEIYI